MTARKRNSCTVPGCQLGWSEHFRPLGFGHSIPGATNGDQGLIEAVTEHVQRHIGPIHLVHHEIVSIHVHVDVYHVAATRQRPVEILVTSGMSERPMTIPAECPVSPFAELVAILPAGWPLVGKALRDERNYWPMRMLTDLARYPHEHETWLGSGHSLNDGEGPAAPFAPNTGLSAVILLDSNSLPGRFLVLQGPGGREIHFLTAVPLYWEELQLKLREGTDALLDAFGRHGITDLIDPRRPNAALGGGSRRGGRSRRLRD